MIEVETGRFGPLQVDEDRLLHFPRGICGFEEHNRFFLIEQEGTQGMLRWLQSCDRGDLAFPVTVPRFFWKAYAPHFHDADLEALGLTSADEAFQLAILTVPGSLKLATANLRAPLLINEKNRTGAQVLCLEEYPLRQPLWNEGMPAEEGKHARSDPKGR